MRIDQQQKEFMIACGQDTSDRVYPNRMTDEQAAQIDLYVHLIAEEYEEFIRASDDEDNVTELEYFANVTAEIVDLVYVLFGLCNTLGLPFHEMFQEIHAANMAKVDSNTGTVTLREDGKILKPVGWSPADIIQVMNRNFDESTTTH